MKSFLVLFLVFVSFNLLAETIVTQIHSYNREDGFVRLKNGRVVFLNEEFRSDQNFAPGSRVRMTIDGENILKSIELLEQGNENIYLKQMLVQDPPAFTPTVFPNVDAAKEMFKRLNPEFKRVSECTDRAHVWSYDEFKKNGVMSQKVFAFFTASYINRNKFKWWFHVAPLVQVQTATGVESMVMDFRYTDGPRLIKEWTDMLVYSKRPCKMTTKFSEYDVNPQTEDCYMIIESMYYRLPGDLMQTELSKYRSSFVESEVNFARRTGFEVRSN